MNHQLESRFKAIELFVVSASDNSIPGDVQGHLFRFGTVLICGYVERSVEIIILERISKKAHPRIIEFVKSYFRKGTNFDCRAIGQLLVRFDTDWYRAFDTFVSSNPDVKEGISSCYAVRNSVAHGGASNVGNKRLRELLALSRRLVDGVVTATS